MEIVFLWMGGDSAHPIEDGLDEYLHRDPADHRRRRLPWPGRRNTAAATRT